jgi:hypothetical protein
MSQDKWSDQLRNAAAEFDRHENRSDGARIVGGLDDGLTLLRDSFYLYLLQELEKSLGADSMLMPVSEVKTRKQVRVEIELYQAVESAAAVAEMGHVRNDGQWYLHWLAGFRLGQGTLDEQHRLMLAKYAGQNQDQRRLTLTNVLVKVLPDARRAPLVLFRLFPMAVQIATAIALGDKANAVRLRADQIKWLPAIEDCTQCHGRVLNIGEECIVCGNPLWKTTWLMIA